MYEYYEKTIKHDDEKQTSLSFENIDEGKLFLIKKKNPEIMGYLVVDELFTRIRNKKWYCVCFHDIANRNVPFAVGLIKKRTKEIYDAIIMKYATNEKEIIALTSDHFKIYESITDENEIIHQQCIFHHFDNLNDLIYPILKNQDISEIEKMSLARETSEYRNIFRTFDENECEMLWNSFLDKGNELNSIFIDNSERITKQFLRHTQFTKDNFIPRTSNQAETFHSLPVIRQIKNSTQTPKGLLECIAVIMQYYKPKTRKQKRP